ncbi:hypothetical protein CL614_04945 [archaeon]|nr:hypothetical protein [archaeon]|tara:strand:- start:308 stop:817 length:510 start_codon:yes stop_codon:yes gene_type:complete
MYKEIKHKIKISDDLLAPASKYVVKFQGNKPFAAIDMLQGVVKNILHVSSKDFWEEDIRWDINTEPREFFTILKARKKMDKWSMINLKFTAIGDQSSKDGVGKLTIEIEGTLDTEYSYSNFIQRGTWWSFNRMFYYKQRRMYIDEGADFTKKIKEEVQRKLGILPEGQI